MSTNPMDTAEGREAFFYALYPSYAAERRWGSINAAATEAEQRLFAQTQGALLDPVAAHALRKVMAEREVLLATCKDILSFLKRSGYDTTLVKQAIALAEGES